MISSILYDTFLRSTGINTDTRQIKAGALFFALKGDTFDGNTFAAQAIEKGALCAVVSDKTVIPPRYTAYRQVDDATHSHVFYSDQALQNTDNEANKDFVFNKSATYLLVNDTLRTLQELATYHRRQFKDAGVLALTGSNGKTTTKELIKAVLATEYRVHATQGNLNNHIGVPLTLLSTPADTQIIVIEMGANHQGEIAELCQIAEPTHGLITGIGKAHLEGFGGLEGVSKGKGEMFDYLAANKGYAFVNGNDARVYERGRAVKNKTIYGNVLDSEVNGVVAGSDPYLSVWVHAPHKTTHNLDTQLAGVYNLDNVLAAIAVGRYFGISLQKIIAAIANYRPNNSRSQRIIWGSNTLILDAYNANPTSMQAALRNLASLQADSKGVILGEMRELGEESEYEHRQIVELIRTIPHLDMVALVGKKYQPFARENGFRCFDSVVDAKIWFDGFHFKQMTILIKGSRGVALERLLENRVSL